MVPSDLVLPLSAAALDDLLGGKQLAVARGTQMVDGCGTLARDLTGADALFVQARVLRLIDTSSVRLTSRGLTLSPASIPPQSYCCGSSGRMCPT